MAQCISSWYNHQYLHFLRKKEYIKPTKQTNKDKDSTEKRKAIDSDESEKDEDEEDEKTENQHKNAKSESKVKKFKKDDTQTTQDDDGEKNKNENMIIIKGDDSLWKSSEKAAAVASLTDNAKSRENEFEDYLEELFF